MILAPPALSALMSAGASVCTGCPPGSYMGNGNVSYTQLVEGRVEESGAGIAGRSKCKAFRSKRIDFGQHNSISSIKLVNTELILDS